MYAAAILLTVCVVVLEAAFLRDDFSVELVADHSSTTTPTLYKMTAMWGSQGGSLLLWAWVLSLASSGVLFATRHQHREVVPWATAVLCGLGVFFTGLMLDRRRRANPFARLSPVPAEGVGAQPAAPPPGDGDPPADALLGLRPVLDPVRVRDRGTGRAAARRELDPLDPPLRPARVDLPHLRDPARRGLVVHGARLGRLLGVGPGRERLADAVARRHGVPALDHGPGAPRHAEGVERVADLRHVRALPARHVPGALRDPASRSTRSAPPRWGRRCWG